SPAMAQTLIRDPLELYRLAEAELLDAAATRTALEKALAAVLGAVTATELKLEALRRFRRREMLRIGVRDLLRVATVPETTVALSDLAAVLIQAALRIVQRDLSARYGLPMHRNHRGQWTQTGFAVIAMGKLGGGELNFSSDVDLLYVYGTEDGETKPAKGGEARSIPNEEYFEYLARALSAALAERTQEGYVYRVDLRLRPEGTVGSLAKSVSGYEQYYRTRGRLWERQALLKAAPIAGDPAVGLAFLHMAERFIYQRDAPVAVHDVLAEVQSVKAMIDDKMAGRGQERRNVKLGIGGIREIEFIVQAAQLLGGAHIPGIRDRNTLQALDKFARDGVLSKKDATLLAQAYVFLRDVEHKLQMVHDLQTHALPDADEELARCAVRLGYPGATQAARRQRFLADHRRYTTEVRRLFVELIERPATSRLVRALRVPVTPSRMA
ncbi:MAG TPA: hypothetical protein VFA38_02635, partial [Nitrospirales bacterium]|nr:hypothetical protein [Nitrospirales bacterium]